MVNYRVDVAYDGRNYNGFQKQKNNVGIQNELETSLSKIFKQPIKTTGASRTDAKAHAKMNVIIFTAKQINPEGLKKALNKMTNKDILITKVQVVDKTFHPRFAAKSKTYRYQINLQDTPFNRDYGWYISEQLNLENMQKASQVLVGKHDFTSFTSLKDQNKNKIREIYQIKIIKKKDTIAIEISGSGFLYNMVRLIIFCLVQVGLKKMDLAEISQILHAHKRKSKIKPAPACGLYLVKINY